MVTSTSKARGAASVAVTKCYKVELISVCGRDHIYFAHKSRSGSFNISFSYVAFCCFRLKSRKAVIWGQYSSFVLVECLRRMQPFSASIRVSVLKVDVNALCAD